MDQENFEYEVSDKTSSFGKKPRIKKGYYPAKLVDLKHYKDKEGKPVEGKWGRSVIMEFMIYESDSTGLPTKPMTYVDEVDNGPKVTKEVMIPKFVYSEYKNKDGTIRSAFSPNSDITKIFQALGWKFSASEPIRMKNFVGRFIEANIDDYDVKVKDGTTYKASTIKDINPYEGPDPTGELTGKAIMEDDLSLQSNPKKAELLKKISDLDQFLKDGLVTKEGYDKAVAGLKEHLDKVE